MWLSKALTYIAVNKIKTDFQIRFRKGNTSSPFPNVFILQVLGALVLTAQYFDLTLSPSCVPNALHSATWCLMNIPSSLSWMSSHSPCILFHHLTFLKSAAVLSAERVVSSEHIHYSVFLSTYDTSTSMFTTTLITVIVMQPTRAQKRRGGQNVVPMQ